MERQPLSDEELRALVRESIGRLGVGSRSSPARPDGVARPVGVAAAHASHVRFPLGPGGDETGACVIEPTVPCTHCGFCQSYGH